TRRSERSPSTSCRGRSPRSCAWQRPPLGLLFLLCLSCLCGGLRIARFIFDRLLVGRDRHAALDHDLLRPEHDAVPPEAVAHVLNDVLVLRRDIRLDTTHRLLELHVELRRMVV